MSIAFPTFADPFLEQIAACGFIVDDDAEGLEWPADLKVRKQASYQGERGDAFVRLLAGWQPSDDVPAFHVHLEFAMPSFFGETELELDSTVDEIQELVRPLFGRTVYVTADVRFSCPLRRVPRSSVIRPLLVISTEAHGLEMRMSGGRFELRPEPLERLTWYVKTREKQKTVLADVIARIDDTIGEDYIIRAVEKVTPAFDAFILAGKRSVEHAEDAGASDE